MTDDIPIRVWRVRYQVTPADLEGEPAESSEAVIWFETGEGLNEFIIKAWMTQQGPLRQTRFEILSVHRVLIETYSPVKLDVELKVQVGL